MCSCLIDIGALLRYVTGLDVKSETLDQFRLPCSHCYQCGLTERLMFYDIVDSVYSQTQIG